MSFLFRWWHHSYQKERELEEHLTWDPVLHHNKLSSAVSSRCQHHDADWDIWNEDLATYAEEARCCGDISAKRIRTCPLDGQVYKRQPPSYRPRGIVLRKGNRKGQDSSRCRNRAEDETIAKHANATCYAWCWWCVSRWLSAWGKLWWHFIYDTNFHTGEDVS